eukprot:gb/GECG01001496.1/.p1 GENE.gb/GECG01001496.1/~~gb/GECG01001496.1/.p1  ORF type:complete len:112 (+),score=12.10 gb/GECG01001496.1/:1-336(+)
MKYLPGESFSGISSIAASPTPGVVKLLAPQSDLMNSDTATTLEIKRRLALCDDVLTESNIVDLSSFFHPVPERNGVIFRHQCCPNIEAVLKLRKFQFLGLYFWVYDSSQVF